jgi:NTE family protein
MSRDEREHEGPTRSQLRAQQRASAVAGGLPEVLDEPPAPLAPAVAVPLALARLLPRPLAFVFGGGGAYGAVQMGMIRALHETDLRPDLVVGTSVGSLNGVMIAADPDRGPHVLAELWPQIERRDVFPGNMLTQAISAGTNRPYLFNPGPLTELLAAHVPVDRIEDLPIPYVAVATDLDTGERVEIDSGDVRSALLASSAIPGVFPWVERDGRRLVDGGLVSNVPIEVAYARGAKSVVVLDCGRFGMEGRWAESLIAVVIQAVQIAARQQVVRDLQVAEEIPLLYLPAPEQIASSMLDFRFTEQLADGAYADAASMLAALALHTDPLPPGLYGTPPLRADHPEVAPLQRW